MADEPPAHDDGPPPDAVCRICFSAAYENGAGRLISPCRCTGSMRYVHLECLNDWRAASSNPVSFYQCEQCLYRYSMERTKYAAILESPRAARFVAGVLLLLGMLVSSLVLSLLSFEKAFYRLVVFDPRNPAYSGPYVSQIWGSRLDMLVAGLLGLASFGLGITVRNTWRANRHLSNSWLIGILAAFASEGGRITRVFAAIGLLHSMRHTVQFVEAYAKTLLTKWGTMILEVRR